MAATAQVDAAGAAYERRELGQPAAGLPRLDRRKLQANILGKAQRTAPGL
jgi:hypothetical protein